MSIVSSAPGYRVEGGGADGAAGGGSGSGSGSGGDGDLIDDPFDLEGKDNDYAYYTEYFLDKDPINILSEDAGDGPLAISVVRHGDEYKALVRTVHGNRRLSCPANRVNVSPIDGCLGRGPAAAGILRALDPKLPTKKVKKVSDPRLGQALLNLEEKQTIKGFKFGLLYAREGQTSEVEMFSNTETSPEYEEFLDFLGDRIELEGWTGYRAGLDVRSGTTGTHGLYRKWNHNEVMFHVSTLLPYNEKDKQQLERKRHIGNDIVCIVFLDGDASVYRPTTMSSRQIHVVFVVKSVQIEEEPGVRYYRLAVVCRDGVPAFGPRLDPNAIYKQGPEFLDLLYRLLMNAERAAYAAPMIGEKLLRTRTALLKDIAQTFC